MGFLLSISAAIAQDPGALAQAGPTIPTPAAYDPALFQHRLAAADVAFLKVYAGRPTKDLWHDKNARKLFRDNMPNCTFHYGRDMALWDAMDAVLDGSKIPVLLREDRYLLVSGAEGTYLAGRGFLWVDLQEGIVLGGFYFHPTNGEPTPTLNVFSRQVSADGLSISQLPPAFAAGLVGWSESLRVPLVLTQYFITGVKRKDLLEHDEDFCSPAYAAIAGPAAPPEPACEDWNAQAADIDLTAADFVEQTKHATNATAWMLSPAQVSFFQTRGGLCNGVVDPLGCRIRVTRERTRVVLHRPPMAPHPVGRR